MDVRQFAFLARQPSAALKPRDAFFGLPKRGLAIDPRQRAVLAAAAGPGRGHRGQRARHHRRRRGQWRAGGEHRHTQRQWPVAQPVQGLQRRPQRRDPQQRQRRGDRTPSWAATSSATPTSRAARPASSSTKSTAATPASCAATPKWRGSRPRSSSPTPYGISCNGCGFINTPNATLTTGKPVIDPTGQLKSYQVDGGAVTIDGQGLNASNVDRFEIITRSAKINAQINARQLTVIAGRNDVDAQTLNATARADDGSAKPELAIDSSGLGRHVRRRDQTGRHRSRRGCEA